MSCSNFPTSLIQSITSSSRVNSATVYQAEIAGIDYVPALCEKSLTLFPTKQFCCHIFSDSQSSLNGLKNTRICPPWMKNQNRGRITQAIMLQHASEWIPTANSVTYKLLPTFRDLTRCVALSKPQKCKRKEEEDATDCYLVRKLISGRYPTNDNLHTESLFELMLLMHLQPG